jgi:hypothetical protein
VQRSADVQPAGVVGEGEVAIDLRDPGAVRLVSVVSERRAVAIAVPVRPARRVVDGQVAGDVARVVGERELAGAPGLLRAAVSDGDVPVDRDSAEGQVPSTVTFPLILSPCSQIGTGLPSLSRLYCAVAGTSMFLVIVPWATSASASAWLVMA